MSRNLHVLIVDDNADDRVRTIRQLDKEFPDLGATEIARPEELAHALESADFDLVITDYQLHWTDGLKILRDVRSKLPNCPVIMLTGTGSEKIAAEAMKAGLDDYVLKSPKHLVRLPAAVLSALDRAEHRRAARETELRYQTMFDGVPVGLYRSAPDGTILDVNPTFDIPDDIRTVQCDPAQLSMAVMNLVSSAVKFSPKGGPIRVRARQRAGQVLVSVIDKGIGRIFDRFVQADMSMTRAFPGVGMGLYITREIVEVHGGRIRVRSTPGKGSTFTIEIPIEQGEMAA